MKRNMEFQTIRSEGGLLPHDLLRRIIDPNGAIEGTQPKDFGLPESERLNEAITQTWNRLRRHWSEFRDAMNKLPDGEAGTGLTNERWSLPLLRELGFGVLSTSQAPEIGGRTYAINRFHGPVPLHLIGCGLSLDRRTAGARGAASANPHGLMQEFLNRSEPNLWAIVTNGRILRVLRDNQALSRQSYLEFDLEGMFTGEVYSDFVLLWMMVHATRFMPSEAGRPETCWLEKWTKVAEEQGTRALGDLRGGVEKALQILGEGFSSNPKNASLRDALRSGELSREDLHGQLLRVIYRLIFLFVAEDRTIDGISLLHPRNDSDEARSARDRYAAHYSTARLRELAGAIKGSRHADLWQQFQILVKALSGRDESASVRDLLSLPALGSFLWNPDSTSSLNAAAITNFDLLEAIRHLSFVRHGRVLRPVDYRNLGAEELGGVYEGLLELTPVISGDGFHFTFSEFSGNERRTSGSYYTPDALVHCLLDSALEPVVAKALTGKTSAEAEHAILDLKVCDPAVGSGHFLVGAAHRLARHLARVRALEQGESEPSPLLYQNALRDVIGRCLYGVDINPMAAELCRVGLWLEALDPGKPLSFLDHHIRVGNSLLGTAPELVAGGLPDSAFTAIEGDDKKVCSALRRRNRQERAGGQMDLGMPYGDGDGAALGAFAARSQTIDQAPDESLEAIQYKADQYHRLTVSHEYLHQQRVADAWCAAFFWPKAPDSAEPITTDTLRRLETKPRTLSGTQDAELDRLASQYRFFHWHLAFPEVFARGGFDCVLGNPPWETMSPDHKEFFSAYNPDVRFMSPTDQKKAIKELLEDQTIAKLWAIYCRELYAAVHFIKSSGRYRLFAPGNLGKGDFNVYRMFVESALTLVRPDRTAAQLVPEGLYNGANAAAIRCELFANFSWEKLAGFENSRGIWFPSIDTRTKFCLYVAWRGGQTEAFGAAFRVNSLDKLAAFTSGRVLRIPVSLVDEFSPDARAIMEFTAQADIDVCTKMYSRYPKFGSRMEELGYRPYMREVDMGTDRNLFTEDDEGLPVFEGRMIDLFDHRAKGYVSGRGRSAVWEEFPFDSPSKCVQPQWRILEELVPDKLRGRIDDYRISFGDVGSPTNARSLIACMVPPRMICGHTVPTIAFRDTDYWELLLWIGVANSVAMDFIVRKKVSLHLSYTILDALPFPWNPQATASGWEIVKRAVCLCAHGQEMEGLRQAAIDSRIVSSDRDFEDDPVRRAQLRAEIDVLVARDVFGLTRRELLFILDPRNTEGDDFEHETFKALRNREMREFGEFRTQRLILEAWDRGIAAR